MNKQALIFALSAVLLWSTVATAFKITLNYLSPLQMVTAASAVSLLALLLVGAWQGTLRQLPAQLKKNPGFYLLLAAINPTAYYLILFQAYNLLPASEAQALNYTWAIALTLMAAVFLGQHIRKRDWVACGMGYLGVLVIATRGNVLGLSFSNLEGVGLALLSTFLWASYWILSARHKEDPLLTLILCFALATPVLIIASLVWSDWRDVSWQGWVAVSYVGLFEMGITFLLWLKAMRYATNTALISNLIFISPFISLILLRFIIGETIYISTMAGLVLIIAGLLIQQIKWGRSKKCKTSACDSVPGGLK